MATSRRCAPLPARCGGRSSPAWPARSRQTSIAPGRRSRRRRARAFTSSSPPLTFISSTSCASAARQCLEQVASAVAHARAYCDDVEFSAEDATRSDLAFLCEIAEAAVTAGATTINLPDTVGYALPADIEHMFTTVGARIGDAPSCPRIATTILGWRSRTRWPPCRPARGRSSARSTASASAPATRRSKRS